MPQQVPLRPGDPRRLGRYRLSGRIEGIPSGDPVFIGLGPDGRDVAVSLLRGDWAHDGAARDRFAAEAAVAKRVPPFCAARVLDAGLDGADAYLVSEYVAGPSLLELVADEGVRAGSELDAVAIAMATGLASVHQAGLVHGNFGPEYAIMAPDGPPRVIEYGITPPYGAATPSADMLAWAQTVVFAAAGRPPARMDDLDVLPEHVRVPVEQCLDPEPGQRPAARAVVLALLGDGELPGGLLAEGSRRAARASARAYDTAAYRPAAAAANPRLPVTPRQHAQRSPGLGPAAAGPARGRGPAHGGLPAADQRGAGRDRPAGSGRRTVWLIAAAVVVAVVAGGIVFHLAQRTPGGSPSRLSAKTSGTGTKSPSRSVSPSASQGPVTPAAFAGSWSGQVRQPPTDTYSVSVTLKAGATSGTVSYSGTDFSCSGALDLTAATTTRLTLSQGILQGQSKCENGQVTIALTGTDTVWFRFRSTGPIASGTLDRS
jgi:eukaryotic-like serine/threonine-protein kinase